MTTPQHPTLEQVTPHIVRISLPLPLQGLDSVNCYAIVGDRGIALVDPGWDTPVAEQALVRALAELGAEPRDVTKTLITHSHWDHVALAGQWQRRYGVPMHLGTEERPSVEGFLADPKHHPVQLDDMHRAGAAHIADAVRAVPLEDHEHVEMAAPDVWLSDGQDIDCGGRTIVARWTPGHTRGHLTFEDPVDGLFMTGDHVLPRITPAVGYEYAPEALPLKSYLQSLRLFVDHPDGVMLPAHGAVGASTRERAEELLAHHDERLGIVESLVAGGSRSAFDVARQMRWTSRDRSLDELVPLHAMTAVSEVIAHLELLVWQGRLERDATSDAVRYTPAPAAA